MNQAKEWHCHSSHFTYFDRVADVIPPKVLQALALPGNHILDWGCSEGLTTVEIAHLLGPTYHIWGIDVDRRIVGQSSKSAVRYYNEMASKRPNRFLVNEHNIRFKRANGFELHKHFDEGQFALMILMNNLYISIANNKIANKDLQPIMAHLARFIQNQGSLVITGAPTWGFHYMIFHKTGSSLSLTQSNFDPDLLLAPFAINVEELLVQAIASDH